MMPRFRLSFTQGPSESVYTLPLRFIKVARREIGQQRNNQPADQAHGVPIHSMSSEDHLYEWTETVLAVGIATGLMLRPEMFTTGGKAAA